MSILIKDLHKSYGKEVALKGVNLEIQKGEILGLLGPNGAGKSTLMKTICGALEVQKGEVCINGEILKNSDEKVKLTVGYLAENNPLYTNMYVREYLWFVGQLRKVKKTRISEVMEQVGLSQNAHKKIRELSKGYKQRVGMAQAILNDPEILILDEPTNGLDPNQINEIRNLILNLGEDKTVLLSTHILQEVEALCKRVVLLKKGEIVSDRAIGDFKDQFESLEDAFSHYTS